ncbi:MAG: hypothetical protein PHH23_06625 [Paludibacteraceae bacterium]|nr:hypothetical protein [Paludibacteraceae bacterium]
MVKLKKPVAKLQAKEMRIAKGNKKTTVKNFDFSKYTTKSLLKMYFDQPQTAQSESYENTLITLATGTQKRIAVIAGLKNIWGRNLQKAPFQPTYYK